MVKIKMNEDEALAWLDGIILQTYEDMQTMKMTKDVSSYII